MNAELATPRNLVTGLVMLAALALAFTYVLTRPAVSRAPSAFYFAEFPDASGLKIGNPVRIAGALQGHVVSLRLHHGRARVGLAVEARTTLQRDASVTLRPKTLLGGRFLDVNPGSAPEPAPPGSTLTVRAGAPEPAEFLALLDAASPQDSQLLPRLAELREIFAPLAARRDTIARGLGKWRRLAPRAARSAAAAARLGAGAAGLPQAVDGIVDPALRLQTLLKRLGEVGAAVEAAEHAPEGLAAKAERLTRLGEAALAALEGQRRLLERLDLTLQHLAVFDELLVRRVVQGEGINTTDHRPAPRP